jgi:hypothetical protein
MPIYWLALVACAADDAAVPNNAIPKRAGMLRKTLTKCGHTPSVKDPIRGKATAK